MRSACTWERYIVTERRAFELGMNTLELVAKHYPEIEIVIAGLDGLNNPKFPCVLKGNLTLKETGELYRSCDVGLALSATNLSYLPVELMASGCPVVTNGGPQVEWFCKDKFNALIANPTPTSLFNAISDIIQDESLRERLISNGLKTTAERTWEDEIEKTYSYITENLTNLEPCTV
jgi:glycosyltransferase involved in cell wall biosynthesis